MKKKFTVLISLILILAVMAPAQWKFNPFTGKFDYYATGSGLGDMLAADWATGGFIKVAKGGLGVGSITANSYIKGNGTGAVVERTYAEVRTDLALVIGTNVQAYDADLTTYAGIPPSANAQTILGETFAQMLSSLGAAAASHAHAATDITSATLDGDRLPALSSTKKGGVPATGTPSGLFLKDDGTWAAGASGAPTDAHYLTDQAESGLSAEVVVTANGKSLITAANYAAMRTLLDLEPGTDFNAYITALSGITNGIRVTGSGSHYMELWHDGTNGNIKTDIGGLVVDSGDAATPAYIELSDDDTNVVKIVSQEMAADWTMTLPAAVPSANNQPLVGATSGTLSFSAIILPASGTIYKLPVYSAANTITELAAVGATGEYLAGATGAIPAWANLSTIATLSGLTSVGTVTTGTWNALKKIIPVDSGNNATVDLTAAGTCYGQIYTNAANDSDTHYDLPAAVVGMSMTFFVTDAFTITVDPNGTERIIGTSANGDYLQGAATIGNMLALVCVKTGEWQTVGKNGTWTEE